MFERFTGAARSTVVHAQTEARALRHHHIGTEHLLLGLLDEPDGVAARVLHAAGVDHAQVIAGIRTRTSTDTSAEDAAALRAIGIDLDAVRAAVEDAFGPGALTARHPTARRRWPRRGSKDCDTEPRGHIPFAPRAKKVLELSLREAVQLDHNYIGTEHILLGLLREGDGMAARILVDAGITLDDLREQTLSELRRVA